MNVSGVLQRTSYRRLTPRTRSTFCDQEEVNALGWVGALAGSVWATGGVRQFSEAELEAVRQVWDRNADQVSNYLNYDLRYGIAFLLLIKVCNRQIDPPNIRLLCGQQGAAPSGHRTV